MEGDSSSRENPSPSGNDNIEESSKVVVDGEETVNDDHVLLTNLLENPNGVIQKTSKIVSITGVPYTSPASLLMKRVEPKPQLARRGSTTKLLITQIINESNVNDSLKTTSPCNFSNSSKCNSPSNQSVSSTHSRSFESENSLFANQHSTTPKHHTPSHFSTSEPKTFEQNPTTQSTITHHPNQPPSVSINIADILKSSKDKIGTTPSKTVSESRNVIISSSFQSLDTPVSSDKINTNKKQAYSDDFLMAQNITPISTISTVLKQQAQTPKSESKSKKKTTPKPRSVGGATPKSIFSKSKSILSAEAGSRQEKDAKEWQSLVNISENDITHNLSKMDLSNVSVHHYEETDFEPNSYMLISRNHINHVKQTINQHKLMLAKRELESRERKKLLFPYISQEIDRVTKNIMSWWDYGYQLTAMANRTVLVDNNTWNNTHIATVGRAMASNEAKAYKIMRGLDVDYVLVIFGGVTGYASDDINKFLWMVRIGGSCYSEIKEADYLSPRGEYRIDAGGSQTMLNSLMYKLSYYKFGEMTTEYQRPPGFDRVRQVEIGNKNFDLEHLEEAFTSEHYIVRIFKVKKEANRS